jgi:hypothetical protein
VLWSFKLELTRPDLLRNLRRSFKTLPFHLIVLDAYPYLLSKTNSFRVLTAILGLFHRNFWKDQRTSAELLHKFREKSVKIKIPETSEPYRQDITEAGTPCNPKFFHSKSQSKMTFLQSVPGATKIDYLKFTSYFAFIGSLPTRYSSLSLPDSSSIIWLSWQTYVWARIMMRIL